MNTNEWSTDSICTCASFRQPSTTFYLLSPELQEARPKRRPPVLRAARASAAGWHRQSVRCSQTEEFLLCPCTRHFSSLQKNTLWSGSTRRFPILIRSVRREYKWKIKGLAKLMWIFSYLQHYQSTWQHGVDCAGSGTWSRSLCGGKHIWELFCST